MVRSGKSADCIISYIVPFDKGRKKAQFSPRILVYLAMQMFYKTMSSFRSNSQAHFRTHLHHKAALIIPPSLLPLSCMPYQTVCHRIPMPSCTFSSCFNGHSCLLHMEGICSVRSCTVSHSVTQPFPQHLAVCWTYRKNGICCCSLIFF